MEAFSYINVSDQQFQDALYALVMSITEKKTETTRDKYVWTRQRAQTFYEIVSMLGIATCTPQQIMRFYPDPSATRYNISSRLQKVRNALYHYRSCKGLYNWYAYGPAGEAWKTRDFCGFSETEIMKKAADTWLEFKM